MTNDRYLFRAWDKYDKKMYKVESINFNCFGEIETITVFINDSLLKSYNKNHNSELWNVDALVLMQYTGLDDKNGKKIFENDYLKFKVFEKDSKGYVSYYTGQFYIVDCGGYSDYNFLIYTDMEVIGTIFDVEEVK